MGKQNFPLQEEVLVSSREVQEDNKRLKTEEYTLTLVKKHAPKAKYADIPIGDIAFKNIAIEMKSWADFVSSIEDGRFRKQLKNMVDTQKENPNALFYYFIHGDWGEIRKHSKILPDAILGGIASILGRYKIFCCTFAKKEHAIYVACKIIAKANDGKEIKTVISKATVDQRAIAGLRLFAEHMQEKGVINLLQQHKTVAAISQLTVKQLQEVDGVGPTTAQRLYDTIHYDFSQPQLTGANEILGAMNEIKQEKKTDEIDTEQCKKCAWQMSTSICSQVERLPLKGKKCVSFKPKEVKNDLAELAKQAKKSPPPKDRDLSDENRYQV